MTKETTTVSVELQDLGGDRSTAAGGMEDASWQEKESHCVKNRGEKSADETGKHELPTRWMSA